jgi:hypothetical protein
MSDASVNEPAANLRKLFSEGLLLALVPLLGYAYALSYQWGRARVFGVPFWLVSIELRDVLFAGLLAVMGFLLFRIPLGVLPRGPWHGAIVSTVVVGLPGAGAILIAQMAGIVFAVSPALGWVAVAFAALLALATCVVALAWVVHPIQKRSGSWLNSPG